MVRMVEMLDVVNEKDDVIGQATRKDVLRNRILHRSASVIVKNKRNYILVTRRAPTVDTYQNKIDSRVAGRVRSGESYEECAMRELHEEIGARNVRIKFLFRKLYPSHFAMRSVYECIYDGKIKLQEDEVAEHSFVPIKKLRELIKSPDFSPSAREVMEDYFKHEA